MKIETLNALNESIAHWERLSAGVQGEKVGPVHCALCRQFYARGCSGCPIMERTGLPFCDRTPFDQVIEIAVDAEGETYLEMEEFKTTAREELAFLKSLLPSISPANGGAK